jgi:hypothetical protein
LDKRWRNKTNSAVCSIEKCSSRVKSALQIYKNKSYEPIRKRSNRSKKYGTVEEKTFAVPLKFLAANDLAVHYCPETRICNFKF